jgi:predicted anti-sigma-YlaC factor YlaD
MTWTCQLTEERLSDYLEARLEAADARRLAAHLETCAACRAMVADVQAALSSMRSLEELPEPPLLAERILDATMGPRKKSVRWPGWLGWVQPVFQPRFVMGLATVLLAAFFSLEALGVEWSKVEARDLNPVNLYHQANRGVHLMYARSVKYVNDLRVVYEIQSMLQPASQQEERPTTPPSKQNQESDKPGRESNQLKSPRVQATLLAVALGPVSGGITQ